MDILAFRPGHDPGRRALREVAQIEPAPIASWIRQAGAAVAPARGALLVVRPPPTVQLATSDPATVPACSPGRGGGILSRHTTYAVEPRAARS